MQKGVSSNIRPQPPLRGFAHHFWVTLRYLKGKNRETLNFVVVGRRVCIDREIIDDILGKALLVISRKLDME